MPQTLAHENTKKSVILVVQTSLHFPSEKEEINELAWLRNVCILAGNPYLRERTSKVDLLDLTSLELDCHSRANDRDRTGRNGVVTEINETRFNGTDIKRYRDFER